MPDEISPATAAQEVPAATGEQVSTVPAPEAGAATPATPTPEAPKATPATPDYKNLLEKPEVLEAILQDERIKKEIEHRSKSVRDADTQRTVQQALAAERERLQADAERRAEGERDQRIEQTIQRLLEDDPTDPRVAPLRADLDDRAQKRQATKLREELTSAEARGISAVTNSIGAMLQPMNLLDPEDFATLNPATGKYANAVEWVQAVYETVAKRAEKRGEERALKVLLPKEREAIRAELRGEGLTKEEAPPNLPGGGSPSSDEFISAFANRKNNDFAQAKRVLGL